MNMNMNKEVVETQTSIHKLPLLVLRKVFKLLSTSDRESVKQVCQRWHDVIHFEVGLSVYVGTGLVYNFPGHKSVKWMPIEVLSKLGIDKCIFGEIMEAETGNYNDVDGATAAIAEDGVDEDADVVKGFMLPELVKELSFYGKITSTLFREILTPVYWLTTLKIHLMVFRLVSFEKYSLRLSCLSYLRIFYTHPVYNLGFPLKENDPIGKTFIHKNLTTFLSTSFFRRIKIFEFVGPYFVDETENLIDAVRAFVARHDVSLKELILTFPYEWNVDGAAVMVRKEREIEHSARLPSSSSSQKYYQAKRHDWGNVQLHRLVIACPTTIVPPIVATTAASNAPRQTVAVSSWSQKSLNCVWHALLREQSRMKMVQYINKYEDWSLPQAIILRNVESLKVISMCVSSHFHVDCKALMCCKNLVKLNLEGNYFHADYQDNLFREDENNDDLPENYYYAQERADNDGGKQEDAISVSRLFNVHFLPETLEEICLSKLMIPVDEIEALVDAATESQRLPNMKSLQLYQICKGVPQFGLSTLAVQQLFDQTNISVSFWQALDCASFEGAMIKALNKVIDSEVTVVLKILDHCDTEDGVRNDNLRFSTLHECHVQLIRKSVKPWIRKTLI